MKTAIVVLYVLMAVWLLFAAAARIAIQLANGIELDALPFIGGAIAVLALILLLPAYEEWRGQR